MIIVEQARKKGEDIYPMESREFEDPHKALAYLIELDLAWGAKITLIEENCIKTETMILQDVDYSSFKGPKEEMELLVRFVCLYVKAKSENNELLLSKVAQDVLNLPDGIGRTPLFLEMVSPQIIGSNRLKLTLMLFYGVKDKKDLEAGVNVRIGDLVAAFELSKEESRPFSEMLNLCQ